MNAEQIPEPTVTGRSCMKEAVKSREQNSWRHCGKTSSMSFQRDQRPGFQNGLVFDQAKRQEIQKHQRAKKMVQLRKRKKKRRRKKKKNRLLSYQKMSRVQSSCSTHS